VYCDPPYVPLTKTANFTKYSPQGFTMNDQEELASMAKSLCKKGIPVLLSNHYTPEVITLYKGAKIKKLFVQRTISCKGDSRKKVKEILALFK